MGVYIYIYRPLYTQYSDTLYVSEFISRKNIILTSNVLGLTWFGDTLFRTANHSLIQPQGKTTMIRRTTVRANDR